MRFTKSAGAPATVTARVHGVQTFVVHSRGFQRLALGDAYSLRFSLRSARMSSTDSRYISIMRPMRPLMEL
jgi:hypothetical protein